LNFDVPKRWFVFLRVFESSWLVQRNKPTAKTRRIEERSPDLLDPSAELLDHVNHRSAKEERLREICFPAHTSREERHDVPHHTATLFAYSCQMLASPALQRLLDCFRKRKVPVPELLCPRV